MIFSAGSIPASATESRWTAGSWPSTTANLVRARDLHHGHDVVLDVFVGGRPGIAGDVVGADHDVHDLRTKGDDVLLKAQQVLRRDLTADAAADIPVGREEVSAGARPSFGNRIAHEDGRWARVRFAATRAALSSL
jgi:hypothetical protein